MQTQKKGDGNVYCRILEQLEKGISPGSTGKEDMEKEDSKLCSW